MLGLAVARPTFAVSSASLVFAVWILLNALAKFIYAYQLWETKSRGGVWMFLQGILYSLFAMSLCSDLAGSAVSLSRLLGLYAIVSFIFALIDAARELLGTDINGKRVKQRVRFKPPVLLTALLPMRLSRLLDDPDNEAEIEKWTRQETAMVNARPNLEIFLHLGKSAAFGFGHMDIALEGKAYSFGSYDSTSSLFLALFQTGYSLKRIGINTCNMYCRMRSSA